MGNVNQKSTVDAHTKVKNQPKHNTKDSHHTIREENKREEKRHMKSNPKRKWQ